jgi:hypothetical protein
LRNKKNECLKDKINELAVNSKNKNTIDLYGGKNEFKKGYHPRSNLVKDENADSLKILNGCKKYFSQLLNVRKVSDVRQREMHTAEPLVTESSPSEEEIAVANLKKYKSSGSDQILSELIQAGGETLQSESHKLINSIWSKEDFPDQCKEYIIVPIYKKDNKTDCRKYRGISLRSSYKILSNILLSMLGPYIDDIVGDHQCKL